MAQRISRAKATIHAASEPFALPTADAYDRRPRSVLQCSTSCSTMAMSPRGERSSTGLTSLLERFTPNPLVNLNRVVAIAMVDIQPPS